ncbi:MAG: hypothetical protein LUD18_02220 [Lachnospiraceae bacterium]|nr:hypothetical protein [Lachnospiraceae bacterium]
MRILKLEGKKVKGWLIFAAGILILAGFAMYSRRISLASDELVADSVKVTWTNDEMEQIDLTNQARKEKIVRLLDEYKYSLESAPVEAGEEEFQPHKGDLEIRVNDKKGGSHQIYLSKEGEEYFCYSQEEGKVYKIPEGDELYQEIAAAL